MGWPKQQFTQLCARCGVAPRLERNRTSPKQGTHYPYCLACKRAHNRAYDKQRRPQAELTIKSELCKRCDARPLRVPTRSLCRLCDNVRVHHCSIRERLPPFGESSHDVVTEWTPGHNKDCICGSCASWRALAVKLDSIGEQPTPKRKCAGGA